MAANLSDASPDYKDKEKRNSSDGAPEGVIASHDVEAAEGASLKSSSDILALQDTDPVMNMKMHLVNNAIDEIGWTNYHMKLFFLNGFGYGVDSLILLFQSIIADKAFMEFGQKGYRNGLTIAAYVGMLTGALFWGFGADIIGRKYAFNISLFICSTSCIAAGGMPNWPSLGVFIALLGFGGGGNLVMDTTVFLEFLPSHKQWLLTLLALWWGIGQAIAGFIAWGFLVKEEWNCKDVETCTWDNNWGWRYVLFTGGALVLVLSILRITIVRLRETPKYLLGLGKDEEVVEVFQWLSTTYNRPCSLTVERLAACGEVKSAHEGNRASPKEMFLHLKGLFSTKKMAISTSMIWFSWTLIGLAYPLYQVFLPQYLAARGAQFERSDFETWRNYALTNTSGIFGPIAAAFMCNWKLLGRKYTMVIGSILTMCFFFGYTAVKEDHQDVIFTCMINFTLNIYYGCLYAYTPEVLPSAHRASGNGISVAFNRIMGIISAVVASAGDTATSVPIYICACLFIIAAIVAALFPFEPYGRRSS